MAIDALRTPARLPTADFGGSVLQGGRARAVPRFPDGRHPYPAVEVHPPSVNRVGMAGVTVEYCPPRPLPGD